MRSALKSTLHGMTLALAIVGGVSWTPARAATKPAPAAAVTGRAIVRLTDGSEVAGLILVLSPELVRIDPDGPVSLQTIEAGQIKEVELPDSGRILKYPLAKEQAPAEFSQARANQRSRRAEGPRPFTVFLGGGYSSTMGEYYEGIGSGPAVQGGLRYHFSNHDPLAPSLFLGVGYRRGTLGVEQNRIAVGQDYWNPVWLVIDDARLDIWTFEVGVTSRVMKGGSYWYFLGALAILQNTLSSRLESEDGVISELEDFKDNQAGLRLGGGCVIRLGSHVGLDVGTGFDALLSAPYRHSEYSYQATPDMIGGVLTFDVGLVYGF